jgi:hypothetical protein
MPERGTHLATEDLDRIRQAAGCHFQESFDGSPTRMRVVSTTYHAARTVIQGGPGAPPLPPDPRPVYLVVVEGDFRRRADQRAGRWLAIYVSPSFEARGHSGPVQPGHPSTDRVIDFDFNELGHVYDIAL